MTDDGTHVPSVPRFLEPPTITALKQEARDTPPPGPSPMIRSLSADIREERQDLQEAAEQTPNVILDLALDGQVNWVSPSWAEVIGTPLNEVEGKYIRDIILDNKSVFEDAVESLKQDDSRSQIVRFAINAGPTSLIQGDRAQGAAGPDEIENREDEFKREGEENILNLEGQGIMVYDKPSGGDGHTMWMLRPSTQPRELTIGLPPLLVESLGVGAEVLANYLTELAEVGINDPAHHPPPMPVLCRICERQITPWWFEKHSDLCLQEHRSEMDVQLAQENLSEHRHAIVKVLDALEARKTRAGPAEFIGPQAEYKGLPIGPSPSSSGLVSGSSSSSGTPPRSRDPSTSGLGHTRTRSSFAVRRPLARIVELILDLCDTASEVSTPALKESRTEFGDEIRTQSPQSESRISQVMQWQSPSSNTLEQEQGLALLSSDTEQLARAKVEAVFRHQRIIEYAERIRVEFAVLVEECIAAAMEKAEQIAAGDLDDSTSSYSSADADQPERTESSSQPYSQESVPSGSTSTIGGASDIVGEQTLRPQLSRGSSSVISTRSSSPLECPTPRSHKSVGILSQSLAPKRGSLLAESDAADSDSSVPSSILSAERYAESPSSERGVGRRTSARDIKRKSLILPGLSSSPRRESPARNAPSSPLRLTKPRLSTGEIMPSPATSPILTSMDLGSHNSTFYPPVHRHHHRRQSSTNSPELGKAPISPHLSSVSHPPPRAVTPSIKDFEIIKPISKGAFGSVYLSKKKTTQEYFAVKVLKKADMVAKNQVTNVKAERAIMMWQGESDFVAKLYWTFASKDYLYLVMEYLNGGDCATLIRQLGGLPEEWAMRYTAEVIQGVEHLHSRGIVHRDLKPDNLLIDPRGHLKLTDFGLSRMGLVGRQKRVQKNPNDSAPDLLKHGPFTRTTSLASSRSASFDFPASQSPNTTPLFNPELGGPGQPSYFSLSREPSFNREQSRRASGYRSNSGGSESLATPFKNLHLFEPGDTPYPLSQQFSHQQQSASIEEESQSEASDSPQLFPAHPSISYQPSFPVLHGHSQQAPMPPAMALFNPEEQGQGFVGTPDYLAPETIQGLCQDEMCDWWSLGCIVFEFIFGYPPFNASAAHEVFQNILARKIDWPEGCEEYSSDEARDLMNKLMTLNPLERLGSNAAEEFTSGGAEVRSHPWFAGLDWDTLLEDDGSFVPTIMHPEDTLYFDSRGATMQNFTEEFENQPSPSTAGSGEYPDRPHDALFKVKSQVNSSKRGLIPLHIPPHIRDSRSRRLSEPVLADDFGNFNFKNLPVLEKANKDVIQKLRQEAMQAQQRSVPSTTSSSASGPSLEGSPMLAGPLKRTMSQNKSINRPSSPSSLSQANSSSPSRPSQPSSPLLVQFSTGQHHHHERRKTSGSSSTFSQQSMASSLQPGSFEPPRLATNLKMSSSAASSPVKHPKLPSPDKQIGLHRQSSAPTSRQRSQTIGSQDSDLALSKEPFVPGHHKRRSQLFDVSPSSSDNEDPRTKALLKVQRRRQSTRRLSQINFSEGPFFRPLDVLICEDHPVSRLVMERLFEKLRCRTITAVNGTEAMRFALSEVQFDIIMTEFKLPQISGADVARMIRDTRSANTHTPIIAVTGYLKDLPETHHFDALVEKPPTLEKLVDVLYKFCQWKQPPNDEEAVSQLQIPASALRHVSLRVEDSASSASSSFAAAPTSSYRGSSREESLGSSYFGDMEPSKSDDGPIIISRQHHEEWSGTHTGGLGITEEPSSIAKASFAESQKSPSVPNLLSSTSAPASFHLGGARSLRKPSSIEGIRAKRESMEKKRYEGAESGDDEDEELGRVHVRSTRSPQSVTGKQRRSGSKLGTEMMRTNSRGSVVSAGDDILKEREAELQESIAASQGFPIGMLQTSMEAGFEQLHISEEVLEALPEVPEKEGSCSPPRERFSERGLEDISPKDEQPQFSEAVDVVTSSTLQIPVQQDTAQASSTTQFTLSSNLEVQNESLTPPGTACEPSSVTPESHRSIKAEDLETTPRAAPSGRTGLLEPERSVGDNEPPPHASDKHKAFHKFERVVGWMRREGH